MKVLIAGAGPTGLTLAIDLARRGVEVRITDKAETFFAGSRGDGIQPRTLEVFDDLGVIDAVLEQGMAPVPLRVHLDGRYVGERTMTDPAEPTPDRPYPGPWFLGQSQTEAILRNRLADFGVHVELSTELTGLAQDSDGVTATLSTGEGGEAGEQARFDYLVGADGGASFVRKAIGVAFPGTTDESFRLLLGDVEIPELDRRFGHGFARAENPTEGVAMSPLPGTPYFQFGTPLGDGDDASLEMLQAILDKFNAGVRIASLGWSTVWRPNVRLAERYRVGRVFLAGDAAHVHPPTGGQGMNTGIQDAYNLGWKLAAQKDLNTYESERRAVAARVLGVSTELLDRLQEGHPEAHKRGEESFGLNITYRAPDAEGPLVTGDRAPDAPVLDADGKQARLFDLFRGPHFTRLVFGAPEDTSAPADTTAPDGTTEHVYAVLSPGDAPPASGRHVIDADGHAFAAYAAAPGDTVLIRPDGYLG